jgi:hypothetical protein
VSGARAYPWTALVEALGEARFDAIREALVAAGTDPLDRDAFLLPAAVGRVLRDLVPADAPAEAVTSYGALLHMLYLHWDRGWPVRSLDRPALVSLLATRPAAPATAATPGVCYVQLPERIVWAPPTPGAAHEPMDGLFTALGPTRLLVLAILGFRPERQGFTTIEADAPVPRPAPRERPEGSAPFATVLPAGERMGLFSVVSPEELAALASLALATARG